MSELDVYLIGFSILLLAASNFYVLYHGYFL